MGDATLKHCSTLHHAATEMGDAILTQATHCNTLQPAAPHCNTLQHTATPLTHCNTLRYAATEMGDATLSQCNALQPAATCCNTLDDDMRAPGERAMLHTRMGHVTLKKISRRSACYGAAIISRLLKMIGLFCKRAL